MVSSSVWCPVVVNSVQERAVRILCIAYVSFQSDERRSRNRVSSIAHKTSQCKSQVLIIAFLFLPKILLMPPPRKLILLFFIELVMLALLVAVDALLPDLCASRGIESVDADGGADPLKKSARSLVPPGPV